MGDIGHNPAIMAQISGLKWDIKTLGQDREWHKGAVRLVWTKKNMNKFSCKTANMKCSIEMM